MAKPKWKGDLYILDGSIVGVVEQGAVSGSWWAYGCLSDWQDTNLSSHGTVTAAKKAVKNWVEANL
jgi:hypothetical protein